MNKLTRMFMFLQTKPSCIEPDFQNVGYGHQAALSAAGGGPLITESGTFSSSSSAGDPDQAAKPGNSGWGRLLSSGSAAAKLA